MRVIKMPAVFLALVLLTTCSGEHLSSVTGPKNVTCDAAFAGSWRWSLQSCGGFANDVSVGQLSTTNGCRLTLDTTPAALKAMGQSYTMIVAFDAGTATLERKGTLCDAIDKGKITSQSGRQFSLQFQATPTEKCCNNDYFANITY
jgi:hypothetical protein